MERECGRNIGFSPVSYTSSWRFSWLHRYLIFALVLLPPFLAFPFLVLVLVVVNVITIHFRRTQTPPQLFLPLLPSLKFLISQIYLPFLAGIPITMNESSESVASLL